MLDCGEDHDAVGRILEAPVVSPQKSRTDTSMLNYFVFHYTNNRNHIVFDSDKIIYLLQYTQLDWLAQSPQHKEISEAPIK